MRSVYFLIFCLFSNNVRAQEIWRIETIKVEGSKEDKIYYKNAESVYIIQENELPATGAENGIQVLNAIPNVEVHKNGESFSIRGINNTGVTGHQKDNLSTITIDGLFQTDLAVQAGSFNLWDVERVEIFRGAQSTEQGVNSLAGSILLNHHRPALTDQGALKLGVGKRWHRELGVMSNNQIVKDKLSARIAYDKEMDDGYITNVTTGNDKWGKWNKDRARLGLLYQIDSDENITFDGKFNRNKQGGTYTQGTDAFKYEVTEDQDYILTTKNYQLSTNYNNKFSERLSYTAIAGFSKSDQDSLSDADGVATNTAGTRKENHRDRYASIENRIKFTSDSWNNLLGFHIHDFQLLDDYDFNLLFPLGGTFSTPVAVLQNVDRRRRSYSIFNSATYNLNQQHSINLGLRGEYVNSNYGTFISGSRNNNLGPTTNATIDNYIAQISGAYAGEKSDVVFLPKLAHGWNSGAHYVSTSFTRGYRTSGVSINRRQAKAVEYEAEYTNNYELAYKFSKDTFQFGTSLFYVDWQDQQVSVQLSNDFYDTQVQNAAKSSLYGGEVEAKWSLNQKNQIGSGVGYVQTEFKEFQTRTSNYEGKEFPFSSNWSGRLSYQYRFTDNLNFLTVVRYLSEAFSNAENTRKVDEQYYLNWNAQYAYLSWMFETYINNVLDSQFRIFDGTPSSATSPYQGRYHQTNSPREFGVRVNYFW